METTNEPDAPGLLRPRCAGVAPQVVDVACVAPVAPTSTCMRVCAREASASPNTPLERFPCVTQAQQRNTSNINDLERNRGATRAQRPFLPHSHSRKKESWMGRIRSTNQQVCATQHTIDPAIDAVLANWGRWAGGRSGRAGVSGVWQLAGRGNRAAAYENVSVVVPADVHQAQQVERVVCNPGFSPKLRSLLQAHYVVHLHPQRTCRELGLHQAAYDEWVWRATVFFANRWASTN